LENNEMANLYKKPVRVTDPKTGKRVKGKSKKWWGRFRAADGREKRVPLAADKAAAQAMLHDIVRQVEREMAGIADPFEKHRKRPLKEHIADWKAYLLNKGNTEKHVGEVVFKVKRIADACGWKMMGDLSAGEVIQCLADLRAGGLAIQTSNHHLRAIKQFSRWLVRDRRTNDDPLAHLAMQNPKLDRRHDRRALLPDEFTRLINAAKAGRPVESIPGADRAMMYVLAAWTGFRKGEIGSLTPDSFCFDADPPTATVAAAYSKRRREDSQVLHPELARQLKEWLAAKGLGPDDLLFPVSGKVPGGTERKTHLMMKKDLERARSAWIKEAEGDPVEMKRRTESDFLTYVNSDGEYADFHSNRHLFITSLERAGLSPKMAQTLARHSDIRLTLGVYTHVGVHDQTAAIGSLPAPPGESVGPAREAAALSATGTDGLRAATSDHETDASVVPTMVPRGAENGAKRFAPDTLRIAPNCTDEADDPKENGDQEIAVTPDKTRRFRTERDRSASRCTGQDGGESEVHPRGFEPLTFGSVDRCSIQLS